MVKYHMTWCSACKKSLIYKVISLETLHIGAYIYSPTTFICNGRFSFKVEVLICFALSYALLILNDSTCQFYYKVNTCVNPYKKNGRGGDIYSGVRYWDPHCILIVPPPYFKTESIMKSEWQALSNIIFHLRTTLPVFWHFTKSTGATLPTLAHVSPRDEEFLSLD